MNEDKTIVIDVNLTSGLAVVLVVGLLSLALLGYLVIGHKDVSASSPQASSASSIVLRKFYLTKDFYLAADADTACSQDFHFASLWEILDPSNFEYDTDLGYTRDDSGQGPPSRQVGWIRTGYKSDMSNIPGRANCEVWDNSCEEWYATFAKLADDWTAGGEIGPWKFSYGRCSLDADPANVWCVED